MITQRAFVVTGYPRVWWTCGRHGRATLEALMSLYPGRAITSNGRTVRHIDDWE